MEELQLIDFSLDDDFLVSSHSFHNFEPSVTMENIDEHKRSKQFVNAKTAAEIFEKREEKQTTNSRDSLAWDSAFFTDAGVLDPDELFTMNKGFEKLEARKRKSTYSEYIFDTDGFFLERNDDSDLFKDVRASIRKSNMKTNMYSEDHNQKDHISKKLQYMSQNKVKTLPTARMQTVNKNGFKVTEKSIASPSISKLHENNRKSKPLSPKPPKISGRVILNQTGSTAKTSLNTDNVRGHISTHSSSSKSLLSSNRSRLGMSCSLSSLITSSSLSRIPSSDSISNCSPFRSDSSFRPSSLSRAESKTRKNKQFSAVSTFRTPLRGSLQEQNELKTPNSPTLLLSYADHSSYDLTPSTINLFSSNSPSVSFTSGERNITSSDRNGDASIQSAKGSKPSGLRMPSPKIGFFDKEHSSAASQFHIGSQSASPHINGIATKRRTWNSSPVTLQARGLSPSSSGRCGSKSPKLLINPKKGVSPSLVRESFIKAQKAGDEPQVKRKPRVQTSSSKEKKRTKSAFGNTQEDNRNGLSHPFIACPEKSRPSPHEISPLSFEENDKENLSGFDDHVACLSKYFEGINLKSGGIWELSPNALSKRGPRLPLADKNCIPSVMNSK